MMTDLEILAQQQARKIILPDIDYERLSPCSYDLTLGTHAIVELTTGYDIQEVTIDISDYTKENPLHVLPNVFLLTEVAEIISLPPDIAATVSLRSTYARMGWNHSLAGHVDPGYHGRLTLELKNLKQYKTLKIWPGMAMVQIVFTRLAQPAHQDYSTPGHHYYGDMEVSGAKL